MYVMLFDFRKQKKVSVFVIGVQENLLIGFGILATVNYAMSLVVLPSIYCLGNVVNSILVDNVKMGIIYVWQRNQISV